MRIANRRENARCLYKHRTNCWRRLCICFSLWKSLFTRGKLVAVILNYLTKKTENNRLLQLLYRKINFYTDSSHHVDYNWPLRFQDSEDRYILDGSRYMLSSVRLSHGCIIQKRLKLGSLNFHHTVAPSL